MNPTFRRTFTAVVLLGMVAAALVLFSTGKANAAYGGCDEAWQAPRSEGAQRCRDKGWLIKSRLVLGPNGFVRGLRVGPCEYEDSRNCYWDAGRMGNHRGNSFVDLGGKLIRVKFYHH